jgi:uncharacterized protein GlcG (DUF336 family)
MPSFTLADAEKALAAAKAKVLEMGAKMSVSVVDPRGDLIAMFRTDGASWRTPAISRGKAVAASCFGRSSADMADNAQSPVLRGLMAMEGGHMIPGQGALPAFRNGELVGAIGGSGGTGQQDEDAARAGIEAAGFSTTG